MTRLAPLAALLLVGCTSGLTSIGPTSGRGRGGQPLPPQAQPTSVIATELAFARAAREDGRSAAFRLFAAPGAQVQWDGSSVSAERWLAAGANAPAADRWLPRQAWSSCDGSAVVVAGIGSDSAGNWGRFIRVWERQQNGAFRWTYTGSQPDAELSRSRQESERDGAQGDAAGEDAIRVEAGNFIRASVADCSVPPVLPTHDAPVGSEGGGTGLSKDRTLRWAWGVPGRSGSFVAYSWNGSGWDAVQPEPAAKAGE